MRAEIGKFRGNFDGRKRMATRVIVDCLFIESDLFIEEEIMRWDQRYGEIRFLLHRRKSTNHRNVFMLLAIQWRDYSCC